MTDYAKLSEKTFSNIIAIKTTGLGYNELRIRVLSGKIITLFWDGQTARTYLTIDGEITPTPMGSGGAMTWMPMADTIISSIEMYNTD